ncbi:MAG: hypothetical protein OEW24_09630 [Chloroflexota bacterium]|nr:hypothetical protein [Chloroflexota bacterium]
MLARPANPELDAKLRAVARALSVGEEIIDAIERFGATSYDEAVVDFATNGYVANFAEFPRLVLHTKADLGDSRCAVENDPALAAK